VQNIRSEMLEVRRQAAAPGAGDARPTSRVSFIVFCVRSMLSASAEGRTIRDAVRAALLQAGL
jgi:hypothetical protein